MYIRKREKGFLLPLVVVFLAVSVLMGYGLLSLGFNARIKALRHTEDITAIASAEAGITRAIYLMDEKLKAETVWDNSTLGDLAITDAAIIHSEGSYSFTITGSPFVGFSIESTGSAGIIERTFYSTTMLKSVYDYSIAVKGDITLFSNSLIDGYNSSTGATGLSTLVGTNSTNNNSVTIQPGAKIKGDLVVGINGEPNDVVDNRGIVTGSIGDMKQEVPFPEVTPPSLATKGSISGPAVISGPVDNGKYKEIRLGQNDVLEITGNVVLHVTEDIRMDQGSEIKIRNDGSSSLTIYIDGDWESKEGSGVNNETEVPSNFRLFGTSTTSQSIDLKAKSDFYGSVYAPNASLGIYAGSDIYGSFAGADFEMKSKSTFYYDHALRDTNINSEGMFFRLQRWSEK